MSCPNGGTTSVSGTVYAPNGTDPLPNILVYIPTTSITSFTDGVSVTNPTLDDAANLVSGNPLVETTTAANGTFTVTNVPPGSQIPMVIQAGRWRREFVIPSVASCTNTPLTNVTQGGFSTLDGYGESTTVRFAQTQGEGDIPKVALVTGKADALECTLRKVGIADTEFTDYTETVSSGGSGPGRINLFEGAGDSGAKAGATTHTEDTLVGSTSSTFSGSLLGDYNVLMLPCQGDSTNYTTADGRTNAIAFTGAGGRIFATHHSAFYINENSPIDTAANWTSDTTIGSATATLNMAFSSGSTLAQWLQAIGSTTTLGQVAMTNLFNDQTGVNSPTEAWATLNTNSDVAQLSFYTPVGAAASSQYGRVMFNEYHVDNTTTSSSVTFPAECTGTMAKTAAMSSQEHMLEYSLFDLMNFAIPVISTNVGIAITTSPSTFTGGDQDDTITVTATNNGTSAIGTSPTVTMAVTLPAGLTAISMIDSAGNWSCTVSTLTCTLLNPLAVSASNSITLTVSVAANVSDGTASIGATMSSAGFSASNTGNVSLDVAPAPAGTITGPVDTTLAPTNVGSTAASPGTLTFAISAGTSIASIQVVTEGFTGKDFTNAGSGTCAVQTYASATTCTVVVNFSPLYPGLRKGAVQLLGGAGSGDNLLDTAYISGFGEGPEAIFQPGAQNTVTSEGGASNFDDVAVDILGNVYVVDFPNHQVLKETFASGSYTQSTAFSSLSGPKGMAIDGAGNIYIADTSAGAVYKETLVNGTYAQNTVVSGLNSPDGVAVDANGNVYIADSSNNRVLLETLSNGSYIQSVIATGLNNPWRVAVDVAGNVYITDTGNNQVLLETLSSGAYTQSAIVTGLSAPRGVAVDSNGTVYIADTGNNRVIQEELVNGSYVQTVLVGGGLNAPRSVAVDELGNLYIADFGDNKLYEEDYSDAPSLSFASTTVNTTSSDSPQTETLVNFGNTALTAVSPGIAAPADFPQVTGNPSDCTTSFSLAAATNCTLRIEFHPLTTGSLAESFVLTDNNLNNSSVTQTIALSGVANPAASIVLSPSSLPAPVIGTAYSQAITASGGTAPYTFAVSSGALPSGLTLSASGILSGTPTAVGSFVFTIQATDSASLTGSQSYTVNIAAPTITVTPSSLPNGTVASSYSQTISATGGSGSYTYAVTAGSLPAGLSLNSSTGALTGTPTAAATSTFTITATDTMTTGSGAPYTGSQAYSLVVNKGTATVTLTNLSQTYTGSPLAATATTNPTGLSVVLTYNGISTIPTTAGTYTVVATINDSNYQGSTTGTLIISRAQPVVTWATPAAITYGTALSATQLNASAGAISGTFAYSPVAGTVLNAGANQTLSVTFTPTDITDYTTATQTVQITVNKAQPAITWATPAAIAYGTALSATQLDASAGAVAGTFVYSPPAGTVLNAGANQTLSVTFTPTNATDYTIATQAVQITVNKAQPTITWATPAAIPYGTALSATQLDASAGAVAGTFVYSPPAGTVLNAGANQTLSVTFTPTNTTDYTTAVQTVQITVNKPQPVITWATPTAITYGTALSAAQLNASAGGIPGTFVYSPPAGTVLNAGANQTLSVIFTPTNTADYSAGSQTVQLTVNKASTRATVATSVNPSLWEGPVVLNATISSSAGTPTGTVSFMNGTTLLGSGTLSSGVATLTTSSLAVGSDPITAVYSGDTNFTGTSSGVFTQVVINFAVDPVSSGGSGSSGSTSQTISPGGTATNTIAIVPTTGTKFPTISYLTVTGLPPGATATLTTSGWTRLTSTSWSLPAFAQLSDVTLLFHVPASTVSSVSHDASRGKLPPALAAFFLAPFGILLCSSRKRKGLAVSILFLAVSLVTTFGLTGCGNSNGFFGQKETSYVVTITVTTGSLSHSMNVTLNVE